MDSGSQPPDIPADIYSPAYKEGYTRALREFAWAREHGFAPTERDIVLALMQAMKIYVAVRGGKSIGGREPEWLHGRADALRTLLSRDETR
jgi:predicted metal-dependent HD superfamily phosphohydrolase